jgi:hypothetical protein
MADLNGTSYPTESQKRGWNKDPRELNGVRGVTSLHPIDSSDGAIGVKSPVVFLLDKNNGEHLVVTRESFNTAEDGVMRTGDMLVVGFVVVLVLLLIAWISLSDDLTGWKKMGAGVMAVAVAGVIGWLVGHIQVSVLAYAQHKAFTEGSGLMGQFT